MATLETAASHKIYQPASAWLVINANSGRKAGSKIGHKVASYLSEQGLSLKTFTPENADALGSLVGKAFEANIDCLIILGGDGTINLTLNKIMRHAEAQVQDTLDSSAPIIPFKLAIIPAGTGNDFIKATDIPREWRSACNKILQGESHPIDLGKARILKGQSVANGNVGQWQYFINNVAAGIDASVGITGDRIPILKGTAVYILALIYHLAKGVKGNSVEIQYDNEPSIRGPLALCSISNGVCYGGTFYISPDARIDDGWLNIVLGEWHGRLRTLKIIAQLIKGNHLGAPGVRHWQGKSFSIQTQSPVPIVTDGELLDEATTHYEVQILPKRIRLIV